MNIEVKKVSSAHDIQKCVDIRFEVFVREQSVPFNEEMDGQDNQSDHYLLTVDNVPVATARVQYLDGVAKIGRVATLKVHRGHGFGKKIMETIINTLQESKKSHTAFVSAQTQAIAFYEKLGFTVSNPTVYMDAGIPHQDMTLKLIERVAT